MDAASYWPQAAVRMEPADIFWWSNSLYKNYSYVKGQEAKMGILQYLAQYPRLIFISILTCYLSTKKIDAMTHVYTE